MAFAASAGAAGAGGARFVFGLGVFMPAGRRRAVGMGMSGGGKKILLCRGLDGFGALAGKGLLAKKDGAKDGQRAQGGLDGQRKGSPGMCFAGGYFVRVVHVLIMGDAGGEIKRAGATDPQNML